MTYEELIKLYPINYQVVENTDIYSLLKYDIMLQLLVDDMVSESPLKGEFLDVKDGADFVTALFDGFSKVDPSPKARIPAAALRVLNEFISFFKSCSVFSCVFVFSFK